MDADTYKLRDSSDDESSSDSSVHPEQSTSSSLSPMAITSSGSSTQEATQNLEAMSVHREFMEVSQSQQAPPVAQSNQNLEQPDVDVSQNQLNPAPTAQEEEPPQDLHMKVPQNQPDRAPPSQEEEPPQEMQMEDTPGEHNPRHPQATTERDLPEIGTERTRRNHKKTGGHKNIRNTAASSGRNRISGGIRIGDAPTSTQMRTRSADSLARGDGSKTKKRSRKIEKGNNEEDDDYGGDDEIDDQNTTPATTRNSRGKRKGSGSKK